MLYTISLMDWFSNKGVFQPFAQFSTDKPWIYCDPNNNNVVSKDK